MWSGYNLTPKKQIIQLVRRHEQTFLQRINTDGQQSHEKKFTITQAQENANQKYNEILPHTVRMVPINSTRNDQCGEDVGKGDPHALLVENQPTAATLGNSMEGPQGIKHRASWAPATTLLRAYPKHMKTETQKAYTHPYVACSIIYRITIGKQPKCLWIKC